MIQILKTDELLILRYDSERGNQWIHDKLKTSQRVTLRRTFSFDDSDVQEVEEVEEVEDEFWLEDEERGVDFVIGSRQGQYYRIHKRALSIEFDLWIHVDVELGYRSFTAEKNVSIFRRINELGVDELYIGGDAPNAMPEEEFRRLIDLFPNSYELKRYVIARVSSVLRDSVDAVKDGEEHYRRYMNRMLKSGSNDIVELVKEGELYKYQFLLNKLAGMLKSESSYSEAQWQQEILQIFLLLYPKYIRVFKEAKIRDTYNNKDRRVDLLLADSTGNVDIVEIKQPFDKCIVSNNKYRDNHIPLRDLAGTVMQIEKYIFWLNKWGRKGEDLLTARYKSELPKDLALKITNPSGIIIMGRDENLTEDQLQDFEVIKRKYKNVIDIITYDELLERLRFTVTNFSNTSTEIIVD